ncbi:hypothetical protein K450DRAFT_261352, partial [Umbelopsis ramanniana AG]
LSSPLPRTLLYFLLFPYFCSLFFFFYVVSSIFTPKQSNKRTPNEKYSSKSLHVCELQAME